MGLMKAPNPQTGNWEGVDALALNDNNGERVTVARIKDTEKKLVDTIGVLAETVKKVNGKVPVNGEVTIPIPETTTVLGKNLFDKSKVITGKYVVATTGVLADNPSYITQEHIKINNAKSYVFSGTEKNSKYYAWSNASKVFISGAQASPKDIFTLTPPAGAEFITISARVEGINLYMLEEGSAATTFEPYQKPGTYIPALVVTQENVKDIKFGAENLNFSLPRNRLYNLSDAFYHWKTGNKFPIAFLGDSTTDGTGTTGHIDNVIGTDHTEATAYPAILETKLRSALNNSQLRIYNAGFAGTNAIYGKTKIANIFDKTGVYGDVKMIGLSHGINDRHGYGTTEAELAVGFRDATEWLINWCYDNGIQPFLVTPQAIVTYIVNPTYPIDTSRTNVTIITSVLQELAKKYNLEIIDKNYFTQRLLNYSQYDIATIIADSLHFGDRGHIYEADMFFALLNKETIWINKPDRITLTNGLLTGTYYIQNLVKITPNNGFAYKISKSFPTDTLLMSAYVFIDSDKPLVLKAHSETVTSMYAKVNGTTVALDSIDKTLATLDLGLHKVEIYTGISNAQFMGLTFS